MRCPLRTSWWFGLVLSSPRSATALAAERLTHEVVKEAGVEEVVSYWTAGRPPPPSDGFVRSGLVLGEPARGRRG